MRYADDPERERDVRQPKRKILHRICLQQGDYRQKVAIPQIISGRSIKGMMVRTVLESNLLQSTTSHPKRVPELQHPLPGGALRIQDHDGDEKNTYGATSLSPTQTEPPPRQPLLSSEYTGRDGSKTALSYLLPLRKIRKVGQLWQTASGEPIKRWDGSRVGAAITFP